MVVVTHRRRLVAGYKRSAPSATDGGPVKPLKTAIGLQALLFALMISLMSSLCVPVQGHAVAYDSLGLGTPRSATAHSAADESATGPRSEAAMNDRSSPDGVGYEQDTGSRSELLVALLAALAGALITLVGDRGWAILQEKRSLTTLLRYLSREVRANKEEAGMRAARTEGQAFPFDTPLSTNAWATVNGSDVAWRLIKQTDLFQSLTDLYDAIDEANHRNRVATKMFHLAHEGTFPEEQSRILLHKAMLLVTEPYGEVEHKAQRTLDAFAGKRGVR